MAIFYVVLHEPEMTSWRRKMRDFNVVHDITSIFVYVVAYFLCVMTFTSKNQDDVRDVIVTAKKQK